MARASPTLSRYLARQVLAAVGLILLGFLGLFAFFDLLGEFRDLGKGNYNLQQVFAYVLLSTPTHAYELLPVAVLMRDSCRLAKMPPVIITAIMASAKMATGRAKPPSRPPGVESRRAAAGLPVERTGSNMVNS